MAPDRQENRLGLGAALYRAGRYQEAIEILEAADRTDTGSPAVLAFLAMAHHQLRNREQARSNLDRLRQRLDKPRVATDTDDLELMKQAAVLITPMAEATER